MRRYRTACIIASIWVIGFCASVASAQTISPIFPAEGALINADELMTRGFEWTAPDGAISFSLVIERGGVLPQTIGPFTSDEPRLRLSQDERNAIGDGRYFWRVTILEGEGAATVSAWFTMNILLPGQHLIPTPTPTPGPPPTELPGPRRIDAGDLFSLSAAWKDSILDPDGNPYDYTGDNTVNASDLLVFIRQYGLFQPTPTPTPPLADWSGSGRVGAEDLFAFSSVWKQSALNPGVAPFDLNLNESVDTHDLLIFISQYGRVGPTPEPTPPVGMPRNIVFEPGANVQVNQLPFFRISWDAPEYPQDVDFHYEMLIFSLSGYRNYIPVIPETFVIPIANGLAPEGNYTVYMRARVDGVGDSAITSASFSVVRSQGGITPTPRPTVNPELPAPRWVEVSVDPENITGFKDQGCVDELTPPRLIPLPLEGDLVHVVDFSSKRCRFFEMMASRFIFEPVAGAIGYEYRFQDEDGIQYGPFTTLGQHFAQIPPQPPRPPNEIKVYEVTVRARFEGNAVGDWSRTLTIIMPYLDDED